jgi:NADH:ubiquinone oxidoreductase subunit K
MNIFLIINNLFSLENYILVAFAIAVIGILGILSNTANYLVSLISIELMFYGLNLSLALIGVSHDDIQGALASVFVLIIAGADSALALGLMTNFFRKHHNINVFDVAFLKQRLIESIKD